MRAAGAAAAAVRLGCRFSAFLAGERVAAAAGSLGVRVVDLEPGLLEAGEEVDRGALEVRGAVGVDHDRDAVLLERLVGVDRAGVEAEAVLEARAPAALDRDAKDRRLALGILGHQLADLLRRRRGQRDEGGVRALDDLHGLDRSRGTVRRRPSAEGWSKGDFVTRQSRLIHAVAP